MTVSRNRLPSGLTVTDKSLDLRRSAFQKVVAIKDVRQIDFLADAEQLLVLADNVGPPFKFYWRPSSLTELDITLSPTAM